MRGLGLTIYGSEGVGKTSVGMEFDRLGPVTFCSVKESGIEDILYVGKPRENIKVVDIEDYEHLLKVTTSVKEGTLVIDSLSGVQEYLFEYVCRTCYKGEWEKFTNYWKGQRVDSPVILASWLNELDNLRNRGIHTVLLGHMITEETPNTMGADYKTHTLHMDKEVRASMLKWSQAVLFMHIGVNIEIATSMDRQTKTVLEGKAKDEDRRLMYTQKSPGHVAKNRDLFKRPTIQLGDSPREAFEKIYSALPDVYRKSWPIKPGT